MNYLEQPNAGFLLLTRQLFSGRVKELACPHTGHTLPFVATQTDRVEARTPYMGFAKMGADCYGKNK